MERRMEEQIQGQSQGQSRSQEQRRSQEQALNSEQCLGQAEKVSGGKRSALTTLCYIEKDGCYLMLHRVKKEKDVNKDKWIGIGGHFEEGESPEECLLREANEETGLTLTDYRFRGLVTFLAEGWPTEYMCLFTADGFTGEMKECSEGTLEWVKKEDIDSLNLWEGDRIFFRLLEERQDFFSLKFRYVGDELKEWSLDGKKMK